MTGIGVADDAWIETTSYREHNRTLWVVKRAGQVLKADELTNDPSGHRSFETATKWTAQNVPGVTFNWKHWIGVSSG